MTRNVHRNLPSGLVSANIARLALHLSANPARSFGAHHYDVADDQPAQRCPAVRAPSAAQITVQVHAALLAEAGDRVAGLRVQRVEVAAL